MPLPLCNPFSTPIFFLFSPHRITLSYSLPFFASISGSFSLFMSLCMYLFRTVLLPLSVYICCSLYLCLSFCLSLSFSLCPSVGCFACLSLSFSVCLSVTLCLPVCLSISVSLSFVTNLPSLILFLARFLSLSQSYHCLSNICKMNL